VDRSACWVRVSDHPKYPELLTVTQSYNLRDHPATYVVLKYPGVGNAYNYSGAYENPDPKDAQNYLENRSGPLASSNARIAMWQEITGDDGITRTLQWNGRTSKAGNFSGPDLLLLTNYLTHGQTSRGRIGLTPELNLTIMDSPYLVTKEDTDAVVKGLQELLAGVKNVDGLQLLFPDLESTRIEEFVKSYSLPRGSNHWTGTAAMGSVVDAETKVMGMENLVGSVENWGSEELTDYSMWSMHLYFREWSRRTRWAQSWCWLRGRQKFSLEEVWRFGRFLGSYNWVYLQFIPLGHLQCKPGENSNMQVFRPAKPKTSDVS
jgi:hypothetical protein